MSFVENYFQTENAKDLERTLLLRMQIRGFAPEEVLKIITQGNTPRKEMYKIMQGFVNIIDYQVSGHGALCKGELKHVTGKILNMSHVKVNQYLLDRIIINPNDEETTITRLLNRKKIVHKPLSDFLKHTETNVIRYGKITEYNSMVWHRDWNLALDYVNTHLVKRDPEKSKQLAMNFEHKPQENNINDIVEKPLTKDEFAAKYRVSNQNYVAQSPIEFSEAERTLLIKGIYEPENIRVVLRMIKRNDDFLRMMSVPDKNQLSYEKIKTMVLNYSNRVNGDREEFWKDIKNTFGVEKFV